MIGLVILIGFCLWVLFWVWKGESWRREELIPLTDEEVAARLRPNGQLLAVWKGGRIWIACLSYMLPPLDREVPWP